MYTENYDNEDYDDNYEEKEPVNEQKDNSNNYKLIIIAVLAIVLVGLLYMVLNKGKGSTSSNANYTLSIYPENITVSVGGTQNISYEVRDGNKLIQNATVRLTIADETIAKIDNTNITGVDYGKTMLTITYVDDSGKSTQDVKEITVADGDPNTEISEIKIPDGDINMPLNGTYDIPLEIEPKNGYVESKKFTSSNSSVVIVDNTGKLTAVSEGNATINIDINSGKFKKQIKVNISSDTEITEVVTNPTKITLNSTNNKIMEGESSSLTYTIEPDEAKNNKVTWSSSDTNVVTVDNNGKITGIKEGTATIKVTTTNGLSDSVKIEVSKKDIAVTDINLTNNDLTLTVDQTETISPTVVPDDATDKTLTYTSSNESIVKVELNPDGTAKLTAVSTGTATISIKSINGIEKTLNVTVSDPTPTATPYSGGTCGSCKNKDCGAGKYCTCGVCKGCPSGNYCYNNQKTACPAGKGSVANSSSYQDCSPCSKGFYSTGNGKGCVACPKGKTTKSTGSTSKNDCNVDVTPTPKPTATPTPTPKVTATPKPTATPKVTATPKA